MSNAALVGAGASFAFSVAAGMLLGIWLASRTGAPMWVLGGLGLGLIAGVAGAWRLIRGSLSAS